MGSGRVPEMWDLGEYHKGWIQASTGNVGSGRVPKMWKSDRVPKMIGVRTQ